jgi:hypothetical protein
MSAHILSLPYRRLVRVACADSRARIKDRHSVADRVGNGDLTLRALEWLYIPLKGFRANF